MNIYDIFFSICLGLFIGGIIFSIISLYLAQMEASIGGGEIEGDLEYESEIGGEAGEVEAEVDIDTELDIDTDLEAEIDLDVDSDVDLEAELDTEIEGVYKTSSTTPAPIMLLLSSGLLVFGITGIILYYALVEILKFFLFIITPIITYVVIIGLNKSWKKIAKSRYYTISSTQNLIGKEGEVILTIDNRGGLIKIPSNTPLKFEKLIVRPLKEDSVFERGEKVFICTVINNMLLVDDDISNIKR
jgi:hypothetical protein